MKIYFIPEDHNFKRIKLINQEIHTYIMSRQIDWTFYEFKDTKKRSFLEKPVNVRTRNINGYIKLIKKGIKQGRNNTELADSINNGD